MSEKRNARKLLFAAVQSDSVPPCIILDRNGTSLLSTDMYVTESSRKGHKTSDAAFLPRDIRITKNEQITIMVILTLLYELTRNHLLMKC